MGHPEGWCVISPKFLDGRLLCRPKARLMAPSSASSELPVSTSVIQHADVLRLTCPGPPNQVVKTRRQTILDTALRHWQESDNDFRGADLFAAMAMIIAHRYSKTAISAIRMLVCLVGIESDALLRGASKTVTSEPGEQEEASRSEDEDGNESSRHRQISGWPELIPWLRESVMKSRAVQISAGTKEWSRRQMSVLTQIGSCVNLVAQCFWDTLAIPINCYYGATLSH